MAFEPYCVQISCTDCAEKANLKQAIDEEGVEGCVGASRDVNSYDNSINAEPQSQDDL